MPNTVSPMILDHLNTFTTGCCINSAERAYHIPWFTLANVCINPTGSKLTTTIKSKPAFSVQNVNLMSLSFHFCLRYMLRSTNSINPIPNMPYTPKSAAVSVVREWCLAPAYNTMRWRVDDKSKIPAPQEVPEGYPTTGK